MLSLEALNLGPLTLVTWAEMEMSQSEGLAAMLQDPLDDLWGNIGLI